MADEDQAYLAGIAVDLPEVENKPTGDSDSFEFDEDHEGVLDDDASHLVPEKPDDSHDKPWKSIELAEEDKAFNARIQARIKKETYHRREEERKAQELSQRLAQREAELEAYRQKEAQHLASQSESALNAERKELARQIQALRGLDEFDDGYDPDKLLDLEVQLQDKTWELGQLRQGQAKPAARAEPEPRQNIANDIPPEVRYSEEWQAKNPRYQQDKEFAGKVNTLYADLIEKEGFNPAHPRIFEEIDRRLRSQPKYSSPVGGGTKPGQEGDGPRGGKGGYDPTVDDKVMRAMKLDPNNPKDRAKYLQY